VQAQLWEGEVALMQLELVGAGSAVGGGGSAKGAR
jgi:hypothetical protein